MASSAADVGSGGQRWSPSHAATGLDLSGLRVMGTLDILRETARILRRDCSPFLAILFLLLCPVSAAFLLLSGALLVPSLSDALSRRLLLVAASAGLPLTPLLGRICRHLAGTLLSVASCFPLLVTLLLLGRSSVVYSVACAYAGKPVLVAEFSALARKIWRRPISTYLWICGAIATLVALFLLVLVATCKSFAAVVVGYPSEVIAYPALLIVLAFSVAYAHTAVVCSLAGVVAVLEESSGGVEVLRRSVSLVKGRIRVGLWLFLVSAIGMAFVEGLFEHRVKTLSYGDGSSRIWEGPLLVVMYAFVLLVDSMMSAVFYFTCRLACVVEGSSSRMEELDELNGGGITEESKLISHWLADVE